MVYFKIGLGVTSGSGIKYAKGLYLEKSSCDKNWKVLVSILDIWLWCWVLVEIWEFYLDVCP